MQSQTHQKTIFNKPALTIEKQLILLKQRGLIIEDDELAKHYLTYIGYYRLSGYMKPFQNADNSFIENFNFDKILNYYYFDKNLRNLLLKNIKQIEIALKSILINEIAGENKIIHFTNTTIFDSKNKTSKGEFLSDVAKRIIEDVSINCPEDKRNLCIQHYYDNYSAPEIPPTWMVIESLSMGSLSLLYKCLEKPIRKSVAEYFGLSPSIFANWIHCLTMIRNVCAHHSRLWNRDFSILPILSDVIIEFKNNKQNINKKKLYPQILIIDYLIKQIGLEISFMKDLDNLITTHNININKMGAYKN
ncbi:MAG: Abi family protein [bacterium]